LFSSYLQIVEWYTDVTVDEGCRKKLEGQFRRLRDLSQDVIGPISKNPSLVDKAVSSRNAETNDQRIARVLRDAYDEVVKARDEMRELQTRSHNKLVDANKKL
jgi:hypothetical protein